MLRGCEAFPCHGRLSYTLCRCSGSTPSVMWELSREDGLKLMEVRYKRCVVVYCIYDTVSRCMWSIRRAAMLVIPFLSFMCQTVVESHPSSTALTSRRSIYGALHGVTGPERHQHSDVSCKNM